MNAGLITDHFRIFPLKVTRISGGERFAQRLLCGEPCGKMPPWRFARPAVPDFIVGKYLRRKSVAQPFDRPADPIDFRNINADAGDHLVEVLLCILSVTYF